MKTGESWWTRLRLNLRVRRPRIRREVQQTLDLIPLEREIEQERQREVTRAES